MAQLVKNLPAMWETWVLSLGWKDALEKRTVAQSSILAWSIPLTVASQAPLSMGILQVKIIQWAAIPFSRVSSQPRDQTQVSSIAGRSLLSEPPGNPKNTGVGSLSLLQWIFPTQESNWGLLHCRRILYQLSQQGSRWAK